MKKLFIGCAVIVACLIGLIGYVVVKVKPAYDELSAAWTAAMEKMDYLDEVYPFDPEAIDPPALDSARFARTLDLREQFAVFLQSVGEDVRAADSHPESGDDPETDDEGWQGIGATLDTVTLMFQSFTRLMPGLADLMEDAALGPAEFAYHSRVLWASLKRLDSGLGDAALNPLRGYYSRLEQAYDRATRGNDDVKPLDEIIGHIDSAVLLAAEEVLLANVGRVHSSLEIIEIEPLYMSLHEIDDPTQMQRVAFPYDLHAPATGEVVPEER